MCEHLLFTKRVKKYNKSVLCFCDIEKHSQNSTNIAVNILFYKFGNIVIYFRAFFFSMNELYMLLCSLFGKWYQLIIGLGTTSYLLKFYLRIQYVFLIAIFHHFSILIYLYVRYIILNVY